MNKVRVLTAVNILYILLNNITKELKSEIDKQSEE